MSGILSPVEAYKLVSEIKKRYDVRLHMHCHSTTGMAEMALLKAIEASADGIDTAISLYERYLRTSGNRGISSYVR